MYVCIYTTYRDFCTQRVDARHGMCRNLCTCVYVCVHVCVNTSSISRPDIFRGTIINGRLTHRIARELSQHATSSTREYTRSIEKKEVKSPEPRARRTTKKKTRRAQADYTRSWTREGSLRCRARTLGIRMECFVRTIDILASGLTYNKRLSLVNTSSEN